jgi:hypothetical protein
VKTGDGRTLLLTAKARGRQVTVKRMLGSRASLVTVRAVRQDGRLGRARTVRGGKPAGRKAR